MVGCPFIGRVVMKLLQTYQDNDDAADAAKKLTGNVRVASERDGTETIYNLFGMPTWQNFYALDMYRLAELKRLLTIRSSWSECEQEQHLEIISVLSIVAKNYGLVVPAHWR